MSTVRGKGGPEGGGVLIVALGRSLSTIDPSFPTKLRRNMPGFRDQTGISCTMPEAP